MVIKMRKRDLRRQSSINKTKDKRSYIDNLFLRIFLSSFILLILCSLDEFIPKFSMTKYLKSNINIVKIAKIFSDTPLEIIDKDKLVEVYEPDIYDEVKYDDGINYVTNNTYSGVNNLVSGYVVKILKVNNQYTVVVKGVDDLEYYYKGLESIDISLYSYVDAKEIIGKSVYKDGKYHFELIIEKNGEKLNFYDN